MLDKYSVANYFESIKITLGGRFPFRSEITAKNRIVFKSNNIALLKALNGGGRSFISRGMGALTKCNVDIPATLFAIHKGLAMISPALVFQKTKKSLTKEKPARYDEGNQDLIGGYLHRINADNHHQNLKCLEKGKRTPVSCVRKVQGSYPLRAMINTGAILSNQQNCLLISQRRLKMSQNLTTSIVQQFQNLQLIVTPDSNHGFFMTTEQVAKGYGVSDKSIQNHKIRNANEILENTHFISDLQIVGLKNGMTKKRTLWTKRGVIRLGMFIKSGRAIKFRDWAENLIIEKLEPKSIKPKRPALPQGSDFRKNSDGIYYYEPMTQYGRIPIGILHGINTAAQTFVTEAVIKEALRRRIKMCEKKLASEFWLKLGKESLKTHDTTGEALYRLLEVDRELSIGNLEIAMSDIFRTYWE